MTPKEYLEIALGGNYNISNLTLSAWEDMLKSYSDIKIKESKAPEMFDLISEMREALIWYQDNCIPVETSRNNDEIFYNLGINLRQESERVQIEATEL